MTIALHIRPAAPADAGAMAACVQAAYQHYVERMNKPPGPMLQDYEAVCRDTLAHVGEIDGELVAVLVLIEDEAGILLDNIAVSPAHQGLGSQLMRFAETLAVQRGHETLDLYTHERMTENLAMYDRLGYDEVARRNVDGYARVYMRKRLPAATD